jgi:hypothetical protein
MKIYEMSGHGDPPPKPTTPPTPQAVPPVDDETKV